MKITANLKAKVAAAKKEGYTHVSSICSNYMTTNYYHFIRVDEILPAKIGDNLSYGRYNGITLKMFGEKNPGSKIIGYQDLFAY